jgi:hypothetical protein
MAERNFVVKRLLKRDHFGQVEEGTLILGDKESVPAVRRNVAAAPWILRPVARLLARRERLALSRLATIEGFPHLLGSDGSGALLRRYLPGNSMKECAPLPLTYFTAARHLLKRMHRQGVTHNDTHKEANWLVTDTGAPALLDFQLASCFQKRSRWFRLLALEDHRHLLKHKKRRCSKPLTPREAKLLAKKSWAARAWSCTLKPVYRGICWCLGWRDREGRGLLDP